MSKELEPSTVNRYSYKDSRWERISDVAWIKEMMKEGVTSFLVAKDCFELMDKATLTVLSSGFTREPAGSNIRFRRKVKHEVPVSAETQATS